MGTATPTALSPTTLPIAPATNLLLSSLPRDVQHRFVAQGHNTRLAKGDLLCEAGTPAASVYLPYSGLVSVQTMTEEGESVELAMIGREGLVGSPVASAAAPHNAVVTIAGEALRLAADALRTELERNVSAQRVLLHYWHDQSIDVAQGSVCHRFHPARQRLARWLLSASDRTRSLKIEMTQERLADALGLQRTGVTAASVALQDAGAIKARHGRITIVDRRRLELSACECYRTLRQRVSTTNSQP
jgi:CRP-like cAMP-binding protein